MICMIPKLQSSEPDYTIVLILYCRSLNLALNFELGLVTRVVLACPGPYYNYDTYSNTTFNYDLIMH